MNKRKLEVIYNPGSWDSYVMIKEDNEIIVNPVDISELTLILEKLGFEVEEFDDMDADDLVSDEDE